jgi:hypothetical protein
MHQLPAVNHHVSRAKQVSNVDYVLELQLPKASPTYSGKLVVTLDYRGNQPVFLVAVDAPRTRVP